MSAQVNGTEERPRLAVFRSNNHIYAQVCCCSRYHVVVWRPPSLMTFQVIDDTKGHTLVAASTLTPTIKGALEEGSGANKVCC